MANFSYKTIPRYYEMLKGKTTKKKKKKSQNASSATPAPFTAGLPEPDFVGITEHYPETLVLMADKLCWPIYDVAGIKKKVHHGCFKQLCLLLK